jgi:hypothetical protein
VRWEPSFCYFTVLQASDKVAKVSDKHCEQAPLSQDQRFRTRSRSWRSTACLLVLNELRSVCTAVRHDKALIGSLSSPAGTRLFSGVRSVRLVVMCIVITSHAQCIVTTDGFQWRAVCQISRHVYCHYVTCAVYRHHRWISVACSMSGTADILCPAIQDKKDKYLVVLMLTYV